MPYRSYFLALLGFNFILLCGALLVVALKWQSISLIFKRWQNNPQMRRAMQADKYTLYSQTQKPGTIVMLGNSLTDQADWRELLDRPDVVNRGISGEASTEVLARLPGLLERKPGLICLMVGVNDLLYRNRHPAEVAKTIEQIMLRSNQAGTPVLLMSVLPVQFDIEANAQIEKLNALLAALARQHRARYLNLYPLYLTGKRLNPAYTFDGLHLTAAGYALWAQALRRELGE